MTMKKTSPELRAHFGLSASPFTREIRIQDRFAYPGFEEPLAELTRAVEQRFSAVLLAPAGTGKTLLLRTLCSSLPQARYRIHQVHVTSLSKRDMYREIAVALGIEAAGTYAGLLRKLQERYRCCSEQDGLRPLLLIDEAQDMRVEVLATLRILTNFEMDSRLILSVVLCGDTRLRPLLDHAELEPVRQRIAHFATLRPLSRPETRQYIEQRLAIASADPHLFDEQAIDAVFEIARGNLRAINHLCRKAMEAAAREGTKSIGPALIVSARQSLLL
jgi:type II secretory pathway predicted ATPase ExeA